MGEKDKVKEIKDRFGYLEKERSYWDRGIWQEIADYVVPVRGDLQSNQQPGQVQATRKHSSWGVYAANLAADGTHGYMLNPATQWFNLRLPRQLRFIENEPDVRMWIDDIQATIYAAFQDSNFYSEMRTFLRDGFTIGTAALDIEEDLFSGKLCFNTLHPREIFIAEDRYGYVDTFFRKVKLTARQASQRFGTENLSDPIKQALKTNPYTLFPFIHALFPRDDFDGRKISSTNKRYASIWIEAKGDKVVSESGYNIFPRAVWRYSKSGNEVYGRSPAAFALSEIQGLSSINKDLLGAAELAVKPAMNIPSEMEGKVRLKPGGMNYYGHDFNRTISQINTVGNFPVGSDWKGAMEDIIEKHFHVDFFLMLQRSEREMTAREIVERMGEKASVLSASIGDLTSVVDKIIDYVFYLETEAGRIPPPPDILAQYGGANLDIVYTGPLAQAQKRLFETQGIRLGIELAAPILSISPSSGDLINYDEALKELLISNGVPQSVWNSPEAVAQIRQSRAAAQQKGEKQFDMDQMSETLKKLSQADKNSKGKMSEQLAAMLSGGGVGV